MEILEAIYNSLNYTKPIKELLENYKKNNIIYISKDSIIDNLIKPDNSLSYITILWKMTQLHNTILLENCTKIVSNTKIGKKNGIDITLNNLYTHKRLSYNFDIKKIKYGINENEDIDVLDKLKDKIGSSEYYIDCHNLPINDLVGDPFPLLEKKVFIQYETTSIFETIVYIKNNKLRKDLVLGIDLNNYKLNMIAHIVPIKCEALKLNMYYLNKIKSIFNNKKILSIIEGPGLEKKEYLKNWINLSEFKCLYKQNNPNIGEAVSIRDLISLIKSSDANEYTFYFHSKGVSKKNLNDNCISVWTEILYKYCISNIDSMIYNDKYVGGAIRCFEGFGGVRNSPQYHFTGTFFWFSHKVFDLTNVQNHLSDNYFTVEMLTGKLCSLEKSQCFFKDNSGGMYRHNIKNYKNEIRNNIDILENELSRTIRPHRF
jgi:hypothetical protein